MLSFIVIGPSAQQLKETSFTIDFRVKGYNSSSNPVQETSMRARVSGPEPGYVATPMIFIALARCFLSEYDFDSNNCKEVLPSGGVLTPQAVFTKSPTIFDFLKESEIMFEIVQ